MKKPEIKFWKLTAVCALLWIGGVPATYAQTVVTGTVTAQDSGDPLAGVTVQIKGSAESVMTNAGGKYTINIPTATSVLVASYVGYQPTEQNVGQRTVIDMQLVASVTVLEELVVVGYGTAKKSDLTGSVAVVSGEDISKRSSLQVAQALQGSVPGVTVSRTNGGPGDAASVRVRGVTTIGDSNPLVLVDGVPGSINDVHPNDIESLSVLKDGASAAIYGARAASGVILITTKRAKSGVQRVTYAHENGFDSPTGIPDYVTTPVYMRMINELVWNDNNNTGTEFPRFSDDLINQYPLRHSEDPDRYPDTKWASLLNSNAHRQSHNLSFTAGNENLRTLVTLGYDNFGTLTDGRNFKRVNVRANNDVDINKAIALHFNIQYFNTDDERQPGSNPSLSMLRFEPNATAFYSDGRVATFRNGENFWAQVLRGGTNNMYNSSIRGQIGLDIKPLDGLKLSGVFAPTFGFGKTKQHIQQVPMTSLDDPNVVTGYVLGRSATSLSENRSESKAYNAQLLANYSKAFDDHQIELLVGYESNYAFAENLAASRSQYTLHTYPYLNLGPLDYRDNSGSASEYASQSYFGRLMYNYRGKYLIQSNVRRDGSSRFHRDHRWGTFPSASVGWIISEEGFFEKNPVVSFLKLRGSWGMLGNERIGNYPYQSTVSFGNSLFHQGTNVISDQTAYIGKYAIQNITWESTTSLDVGLDAYLFENKLQLTADYYAKTTSQMLLALEIPDFIGLQNPDQNTGEMKTKGWEMALTYRSEIGKLNYSVSANLADSRSIMGDLGGTEFLGDQVKFKGSEFNEWYGYKSDGIYQTQDEVDNSTKLNARVKPGDIRYLDISGPDGVPDGVISAAYDRTLLGGSLPRLEYGGNIAISYGPFDLSVVFQGVGKRNSYLDAIMVQPLFGGVLGAPKYVAKDYWSLYNTPEANQNARYPRLSEVGSGAQDRFSGNNYVTSDYWLINGGYLRVKNVVLGYSLPESLTGRLKISNLRVNCNLIDFFSLSKFPKGIDPELSSSGYFINKAIVFGLSLSI